jgi:hypothetical protein
VDLKKDIEASRREAVALLAEAARRYLHEVDKEGIETILLSGSVARGDYFPGDLGGMIDLTVMRKIGSRVSAEELFGKNEDPDIPFHCVRRDGNWYQISLTDFVDPGSFEGMPEASKYALLESKELFDPRGKYGEALVEIRSLASREQKAMMRERLGYIGYLVSDYKKDRWLRRGAFAQLHENLSVAIDAAIRCVYYLNGRYCPAEDRRLYYSLDLESLPPDYMHTVAELRRQEIGSKDDYDRREALFRSGILGFLEDNIGPMG